MNIGYEYLKILKNDTIDFFKLVLGKKYRKNIVDEFIDSYINQRYYNYEEKTNKNKIKSKISKTMEQKKNALCKENPEKRELIIEHEHILVFIQYLDYLISPDSVELLKTIKKFDDYPNIKEQIESIKKQHDEKVKELLSKLESKQFYLETKKSIKNKNIKFAQLQYSINFPMIYSQYAISQAFNTGKINEDKFYVTYYLLAYSIINDIIKGDFNSEYIVEFPETVFEKKQKFHKLMEIIENEVIHDKLCIMTTYDKFEKYKNDFNYLIKNGYNVALKLKNKINPDDVMRLEVFKYILIDKELEYFDELNSIDKHLNIMEI